MKPPLSVVIAARDESQGLPALLADLAMAPELVREVLVVDGGSRDGTPRLAALAGAQVLHDGSGRGGKVGGLQQPVEHRGAYPNTVHLSSFD